MTKTSSDARGRGQADSADSQRLAYSVDETAVRLGVSLASVHRALRRGELGAVRLGVRWLIPAGNIAKLLAGKGREP